MKNQLKTAFMAAAILFSATAMAQTLSSKESNRSPEEKAKIKTQKMTERLGLDEKQQQVVFDVNLKYSKMMEEARAKRAEQKAEAKNDFEEVRMQYEKELKAHLNEKQQAELDQMHEEREKKAQMRREQHKKDNSTARPKPAATQEKK